MANSSSSSRDDFHSRALSSFHNQLLLQSNDSQQRQKEAETYAQCLVEDDAPTIDSAVKAYLCLVAARSAVQSEIDVISTSPLLTSSFRVEVADGAAVVAKSSTTNDDQGRQCCSFAGSVDANRCALICARTLSSTINSTILPPLKFVVNSGAETEDIAERVDINDNDETERNMKQLQLQLNNNITRIIWNKLVANKTSSSSGDNATKSNAAILKPSKVLGRQSLLAAYPYIQERFRRGIMSSDDMNAQQNGTMTVSTSFDETHTTVISTANNSATSTPHDCPLFNLSLHSLSNEILPPVLPPKGIDVDKWKAFYTEFGQLLLLSSTTLSSLSISNAKRMENEERPNDSALIWSKDGGAAELQLRREKRTRRAAEALTFDSDTVRGEGDNNK